MRKFRKNDFPDASRTEHDRVRPVLVVEVQEVRRAVVRFEHGQVLRSEVGVLAFASVQREQERKVGIVGAEEMHRTEVVGPVAGDRGEKSIQDVVPLFQQHGIVRGEHLESLSYGRLNGLQAVVRVQHQSHAEPPEVVAVDFHLAQASPEVRHESLGAVVDEHLLGIRLAVPQVVGHRGLAVVEVTPLALNLLASFEV